MKNISKILIVKTSAMGDIIHAFHVVAFLKARFPSIQIDWVVEKASLNLVRAHPDVRRAIAIDTKQWRKSILSSSSLHEMKAFRRSLQEETYDVVFDLQGNSKSGIITWLAKSAHKVGFARSRVPEWPNLLATNRRYAPPKGGNIRSEYLYLVQEYLQDATVFNDPGVVLQLSPEENLQLEEIVKGFKKRPLKTIMICPGSNWKNKQLSEATLKEFLQLILTQQPCQLAFVWGSDIERIQAETLAAELQPSIVLQKMSLPLLQNVMSQVDLTIAMDSLALHLAATTKTPTFSVFGASLASKYKPLGDQHVAFQGACPYGQKFEARCPKLRRCATGACIRSLSGKDLYLLMSKILS